MFLLYFYSSKVQCNKRETFVRCSWRGIGKSVKRDSTRCSYGLAQIPYSEKLWRGENLAQLAQLASKRQIKSMSNLNFFRLRQIKSTPNLNNFLLRQIKSAINLIFFWLRQMKSTRFFRSPNKRRSRRILFCSMMFMFLFFFY